MKPQTERTWALVCHLAALTGFIGVPLGNVVGPLVVWLLGRNESHFVEEHGKESVNFHLSLVVYLTGAALLLVLPVFVFLGGVHVGATLGAAPLAMLLLAFAVFVGFFIYVMGITCTLQAAIKASQGEGYLYPFSLRFIQ